MPSRRGTATDDFGTLHIYGDSADFDPRNALTKQLYQRRSIQLHMHGDPSGGSGRCVAPDTLHNHLGYLWAG